MNQALGVFMRLVRHVGKIIIAAHEQATTLTKTHLPENVKVRHVTNGVPSVSEGSRGMAYFSSRYGKEVVSFRIPRKG